MISLNLSNEFLAAGQPRNRFSGGLRDVNKHTGLCAFVEPGHSKMSDTNLLEPLCDRNLFLESHG